MIGQCRSTKKWNVIILAGGKGTRMGEMSSHLPKALAPIGNRRAIDYIIDRYKNIAGKFIVGIGANGDLLKNYLKGSYPDKMFEFSEEEEARNNAVSTRYCLDFADSRNPTLITFCDLIIIGNWELEKDTIYLATRETKGHVGKFRHSIVGGEIVEWSIPVPVGKYNGVVGCFAFSDTVKLKAIAYGVGNPMDITIDFVHRYFSDSGLVTEDASGLIEFGTEEDLKEARKIWEKL